MSLPPNGQYSRGEDFDTSSRSRATTPEFFWHDVEIKDDSGKVVKRFQREMVRLVTAGDNLNVPEAIVTDRIRNEWPAHYAAWKNMLGEHKVGTPLADWPGITTDQIRAFHSMNVFTVEALSEIADVHLTFMGGPTMKRRAQEFVANKATMAEAERLRRDKEAAERFANDTMAKLMEMQAQLDALKRDDEAMPDGDAPARRGPGRPRKNPEPETPTLA